ncbi:MAG: rhodanese-like domain-containing protein [Ignavibacteria bacterium]|nr:rhodanese-like domain-containing protein [Ignavibacteria bacterium]
MEKINWKQILKESAIIIGITIFIAIIFNTLNPFGINLLKKPTIASDTLLEKLLSNKITDTTNSIETEQIQTNNKKDTLDKISNEELALKTETPNQTILPPTNENKIHSEEIPSVTYQQLIKHLNSPNLILIDARSPEEFTKEHIGRAINIYAYEEDLNKYFQKLVSVPIDNEKVIIVYCEGGTCDASHKVATDLIRLGHKNVFIYTGGWEEWTKHKSKNE